MSRYSLGNVFITEEVINAVKEDCGKRTSKNFPIYGEYDCSYGFDYACGYFIQFISLEKEDVSYDLDTFFTGLTGSELSYILKFYKACKEHIDNALLDLSF